MLIAKYTTNGTTGLPIFNEGFEYTYTETQRDEKYNTYYDYEIYAEEDFSYCNFTGKTNLLTVEYLKVTDKVTSMEDMFYNCSSLTALDISGFNTSNVTNMSKMFQSCFNLTSLDLSSFNTSNVTNMSYMFNFCQSLTSLNLSSFNTSEVTDMSYMFQSCSNLTELDVSSFNTSNVTNMSYMFNDCPNLTSLNLNSFNTSKVTNMSYMFALCTNLASLDISNFDTSKVTNIDFMFNRSLNLVSVNMNNSDTSSINKIISKLPTRTTLGHMYISRDISSDVDVYGAESKMWKIIALGGPIKNVYINGNKIINTITGQNKKIKGIYLGDDSLL